MRNALAFANKTRRHMVSAVIGTVFVQETPEAARKQWRGVADQFREKLPTLAACMDDARNDVLAFMTFPIVNRPGPGRWPGCSPSKAP